MNTSTTRSTCTRDFLAGLAYIAAALAANVAFVAIVRGPL